jgi:phage I-like protein
MSTMNERFQSTPILFAGLDTVKDSNGVPRKVQVLRVGNFMYQDDSMDEPEELEITPAMLASMVTNFNEKVRGVDPAFDYSHKSGEKAAGWFKKLVTDESGKELWAEVDWTLPAAQALANKEYRYVSADISWNYQDNETGKKFGPTLNGAALTNRPYIKNMAPAMALTEGGRMAKKLDEQGGDDDIKTIKARLEALEEENKTLRADKAKATETAQLAEKKGEFDVMLSEGKVVEAQRDPFMKNDMKGFLAKQKKLNLSEHGSGGDPGAGDEDGDEAAAGPKNHAECVTEVRKRAKTLLDEKKNQGITMRLSEAYGAVLAADEKLSVMYHKGPEAPAPRHPRRKLAAAG